MTSIRNLDAFLKSVLALVTKLNAGSADSSGSTGSAAE
ncbi:hypothetical protein SZ00_00263 [Rhodococcus sp. AD45]|nr:hypothetical protein SZ00_00263 [Rhodococcus sp. AD45]